MIADAASSACASQSPKATILSSVRPVYNEDEYDSEAETLVGSESDDDDDDHSASANNQPATGHGATVWSSANEPCAPTQNNIGTVVRAPKAKEMEAAAQRSLPLIPGAGRK
jgi:hypothetical protein